MLILIQKFQLQQNSLVIALYAKMVFSFFKYGLCKAASKFWSCLFKYYLLGDVIFFAISASWSGDRAITPTSAGNIQQFAIGSKHKSWFWIGWNYQNTTEQSPQDEDHLTITILADFLWRFWGRFTACGFEESPFAWGPTMASQKADLGRASFLSRRPCLRWL